MSPAVQVPSLSVRAFAELLRLPAYEQVRVLNDQKYPASEPQSFKIPYYQPALKGIRDYYRTSNDPAALGAARAVAKTAKLEARRKHNLRVIAQFEKSVQAKRKLVPKAGADHSLVLSGVLVRLRFDLVAEEGKSLRHILYDPRDTPVDDETARSTLELAAHVLQSSGSPVLPKQLEYVAISSGHSRTITTVRARTMQRIQANAKLIKTLWPTI